MAYDKSFYEMYADYLTEKSVRASHDFIFRQFLEIAGSNLHVIDLGCGLGEYFQYGSFTRYVGVDKNNLGDGFRLIKEDYYDLDKVKDGLSLYLVVPNILVSLFSIECFYSVPDKYAFYERIFKEFPSIEFGLVSGFFYESKRNQETVGEAGGIVSHQTIEDPSLYISEVFTESRLHLKTPSKMFGPDVIEVWKI